MPYFIYHIHSGNKLEFITQFDAYRAAKQDAKQRRAVLPADADYKIKIMFAKSVTEAELLLKDKREPQPMGDD